MTLQEIYELAIEMAINADPRGITLVKKQLAKVKKDFNELPEKKKIFFDKESLTNPYYDSRFLYGNPKKQVKKIIAGIDAGVAELLLIDRLNQKGLDIDALITHHPHGAAYAGLHETMDMQIDVFEQAGIPGNVAQALMDRRKKEIAERMAPRNHNQMVDAAKLLDIPLIAMHALWDNLGDKFIRDYISGKEYETVGDILEDIMNIPEFIESTKGKAGPAIPIGKTSNRAGKVVFAAFTGGTNPSKEMYVELVKAGAGTIIDMHLSADTNLELKKHHVSVVDLGHIASDSIGANLFLDAIEKKGIKVITFGGLIRVKRVK